MHVSASIRRAAFAVVCAQAALLHHGHIHMFMSDLRSMLAARLGHPGRRATVRHESSRIDVSLGDALAHYEIAVRPRTRTLEIVYVIAGARDDVERRVAQLESRSRSLIGRLGSRVELERQTSTRARLRDAIVLTDRDWSPKRDLTPQLARETARRATTFVRAIESIVSRPDRGRTGPRPAAER